jgi:hypothetical protein
LRVMPAAPSREPSARRAWSIGSARPRWDRVRELAARTWSGHRLFIIVLTPAVLLRVDAELGYRWQNWFNDSFEYVQSTVHFTLDPTRVSGYSIGLKFLQVFHSYASVTILQHLMGLAIAVMIYALARHRFRTPAWLATLAAVPVLYDGFQIELEHLIMADVPFLFLVTLAMTLLLWDPVPSLPRCALVGALLGVAEVMRSVGVPLLAVFAVYMIIRRISWRKVAAAIVLCFVPVVAYCGMFYLEHGQFAMTDSTGVFIYARVMTFADCATMHVPVNELSLCTTVPPSQRPIDQSYVWDPATPLDRFPPSKFSPVPNQLAEDFAIRAIEAQPLDYAKAVFDDTWRVFRWNRHIYPNAQTYDEYIFGYHSQPIPSWNKSSHLGPYDSYAAAYVHGNPLTQVVEPFANVIRGYQRYVWVPGTVYGLVLLTGLAGLVLAWRRLGGEALLPWVTSLALIVIPAATATFDYRYVLPAVPFAFLAAAIAFSPGSAGGDLASRLWARLAGRGQRTAGVAGAPAVADPVPAVAGPVPAVADPAGAAGAGDDKRDLASDGA